MNALFRVSITLEVEAASQVDAERSIYKVYNTLAPNSRVKGIVTSEIGRQLPGDRAAALMGPGRSLGRRPQARARKVEVLLFARHTRKWEFAKQEWNEAQLKWQWVRSRDGGSYICKVGDEIAIMDAPPPPAC